MRRLSLGLAALFALLTFALAIVALPTLASDHDDAPRLRGKTQLDLTDLFAFSAPVLQSQTAAGSTGPTNTVLIMSVNPFAGVAGPALFSPLGSYEFVLDTTGDAREDLTYSVTFSAANRNGQQTVTVKSAGVTLGTGQTGTTIALSNGGTLLAGLFDDPYFFDAAAYQNGMQLCQSGRGANFYAGANINAIVLDLPASVVATKFGVWARTMDQGQQVDRLGLPALSALLIGNDKKDAYAAANPADDPRVYSAEIIATLKKLGHDDASAAQLTQKLLPDILTIDPSVATTFASLNGRQLADDTVDTELALVTNGRVKSDCVANDSPFQQTFPYLAPANAVAPTPGLPNTGAGGAQATPPSPWFLAAFVGCLLLAAGGAVLGLKAPRR